MDSQKNIVSHKSSWELIEELGIDIWRWEIKRRFKNNLLKYILILLTVLLISFFWIWIIPIFVFLVVSILIIDFLDTRNTFKSTAKLEKKYKDGYVILFNERGFKYDYINSIFDSNFVYWSEFKNIVEFGKKGVFVMERSNGEYHSFFRSKMARDNYELFKKYARNQIKRSWQKNS